MFIQQVISVSEVLLLTLRKKQNYLLITGLFFLFIFFFHFNTYCIFRKSPKTKRQYILQEFKHIIEQYTVIEKLWRINIEGKFNSLIWKNIQSIQKY